MLKDFLTSTIKTAVHLDLPGSGKSREALKTVNETDLMGEIIIWCGFTFQDLVEKAKYCTKNKIIIGSSNTDHGHNTPDDLKNNPDVEVIFTTMQLYRKMVVQNEATRILNKGIKAVIIDELSVFDFMVPPELTGLECFSTSTPDLTVNKKFSTEDVKKWKGTENPFYAHFVSNKCTKTFILTAERLTAHLLSKIGYYIYQGDTECQKDCILYYWEDTRANKKTIIGMDCYKLWTKMEYDFVFCNASDSDDVRNFTQVRGSNNYKNKTNLTIFRSLGPIFERSFLKFFSENELDMFYSDMLNQTVSRTLGWRGAKVGYVLIHPIVRNRIKNLPYRFVQQPILGNINDILNEANKVDDDYLMHFVEGAGVPVKEVKKKLKELEKGKLRPLKTVSSLIEYLNGSGISCREKHIRHKNKIQRMIVGMEIK